MGEADRLTIAGGVPGIELMENAGRAVADAVSRRWPRRPVWCFAGRATTAATGLSRRGILAERGWPVRVALLGDRHALRATPRSRPGDGTGRSNRLPRRR